MAQGVVNFTAFEGWSYFLVYLVQLWWVCISFQRAEQVMSRVSGVLQNTTGLSVAVGQCKCLPGECSGVLMMCSAALATH